VRLVVLAAQPHLAAGDGLKPAIKLYKQSLRLQDTHLPPHNALVGRFRQLKAQFEAAMLLPTKHARTRTLLNLFLDTQQEIGGYQPVSMIPEGLTDVTPGGAH
jgi:hypothetical protein